MKTKPIIEFKNVFLDFKSKNKTKVIFDNFNFVIKEKQKVIIFGKSGTGKSTLLQLILGFKQAKSGNIFFDDKKITHKNIWEVRSQIAYVDQDVMMGEGLVKNIIAEYFSFVVNLNNSFSQKKLETLMQDFDLDPSLLYKNTDQLSGGEKQRLALVVALLLERKVMILDEITSALDPLSKTNVIKKLLKNNKLTLVVVTHDKQWQNNKNVAIFDFKEKKWIQ